MIKKVVGCGLWVVGCGFSSRVEYMKKEKK